MSEETGKRIAGSLSWLCFWAFCLTVNSCDFARALERMAK